MHIDGLVLRVKVVPQYFGLCPAVFAWRCVQGRHTSRPGSRLRVLYEDHRLF